MSTTTIRLDKYLADLGIGTRSEVKSYLKKGLVTVNNESVRDPGLKINIEQDVVCYQRTILTYNTHEYYMLNKPAGVLSATEDKKQKTVIDLITVSHIKDLFPVGRLDKDTEGLLLITNDGDLAHRLLSPNKHVGKTYYAKIDGIVTKEDIQSFSTGLSLGEDFISLPAELKILKTDETTQSSEIEVTIYEGKFHQVKRMFEAVGKSVTYLKRLSMGSLHLDSSLEPGEYRPLTEDELESLRLLTTS